MSAGTYTFQKVSIHCQKTGEHQSGPLPFSAMHGICSVRKVWYEQLMKYFALHRETVGHVEGVTFRRCASFAVQH